MTFIEWCKATSKETNSSVSRDLVKEIMITAIRVAIEELMANPVDASLDIMSIGRFYLDRVKIKNVYIATNETGEIMYWRLKFKVAKSLRDSLNNRKDIRELSIGGANPLYPEYNLNPDGTRKKGKGRKPSTKTIRKKYIITEKVIADKHTVRELLPDREEKKKKNENGK